MEDDETSSNVWPKTGRLLLGMVMVDGYGGCPGRLSRLLVSSAYLA